MACTVTFPADIFIIVHVKKTSKKVVKLVNDAFMQQ